MRSVDFPMPGSPPTRTMDPGTIPPHRTKSNSAIPVRQRATPLVGTLDSWTGVASLDGRAPSNRPTFRPIASSTSEFHAAHASHRPPHLGCSAPHSVQRNTDRPLATRHPGGRLAGREVVEPGVFLLEVQLHRARGTVALFPNDDFGQAFDVLVALRIHGAVVELLPVDETDEVGVLLDRARLTQ